MFGKPRDIDDTDTIDQVDGFFGDEAAAETIVEVHELQQRVVQVEAQINSQFTSLATYAQIAQEQVELARSEAKATTERSEQRLTSLIERERADRISSFTGSAPAGSAPDVTARLDALEHSVAQIRKGLDECLSRQKSLADAITVMFERMGPAAYTEPVVEPAPADHIAPAVMSFGPPSLTPPSLTPRSLAAPTRPADSPLSGPIADLSLDG